MLGNAKISWRINQATFGNGMLSPLYTCPPALIGLVSQVPVMFVLMYPGVCLPHAAPGVKGSYRETLTALRFRNSKYTN